MNGYEKNPVAETRWMKLHRFETRNGVPHLYLQFMEKSSYLLFLGIHALCCLAGSAGGSRLLHPNDHQASHGRMLFSKRKHLKAFLL